MPEEPADPSTLTPPARPGLVRAVGVLNLLVGGVLLLAGLGLLALAGPALARNHPLRLDPAEAEAVLGEMHEGLRTDLRHMEKSAATEARRGALRRALESLDQAGREGDGRSASGVDYRAVNADLPWLAAYLWADVLTGPVLNLLAAVSGVGLVRLRGWGRRLAVSAAVWKIVRLAALGVLLAAVVVPRCSRSLGQFARTDVGAGMLAAALDRQAAGSGGGPALRITPEEFLGMLAALGYAYALLGFALGAVYPAAVLATLCRPEARAAVAGPPPRSRDPDQ